MQIQQIKIKQALNKAYLREKVNRVDIELFKRHFADLLNKINDKADEEHLKSLIADFLKFTWYKDAFQINPVGKNDLVIHTGKSPADPIGVIMEVKSLANKIEMMSVQKPNAKAIHELILYYLNERITNNKHEIKQLIATNIFEWFVFDANEFDKKIYRNNHIKKLYEQKIADHKDNPWFYEEIRKLLDDKELSLEATYFDIRDYKTPAKNSIKDDDIKLIPLFKILSPVHLLKLSFANDSNSLQPKFYSELLHLIGLYEYKDGSKKLISRKKEGERNAGSLLENTIVNLDSHDKISRLNNASAYGENYQQRLYNVALELVITWINRILFLKLLEAQLLNYHKGDSTYVFLNKDKIRDFDDLDKLFFRVLAKKPNERSTEINRLFGNVPYLNSSLFEPTELEHQTLFINGLEDFVSLPVLSSTVLKDNGKTSKGSRSTLDYIFDFLNAYDFSSEGAEEIQEDNKTLINASVLGLIFEKINGYKDGSFFTPGFITMYMCRETIRRAVVQKFNDAKGWEIKEYGELYNKITDLKEANSIINSLKICDPAVGSGHFLVSALNEIIAIKSDLNVLISGDGRTLRGYHIEVVNDELIVTDENNDPFKYNFHDARSQTVQQTLFHEKQTIIENCLFGVDINPNSVKICRLRLWIELLKNAYYKPSTNGQLELETLPNIDINIKTGNSLISRFALDVDLKQALKKNNIKIETYRNAVDTYRNARDKTEKREMENIINAIKSSFTTEISRNGKEYNELSKLRGQLQVLISTNQDLFGIKRSKKELELEQRRLELSIEKQEETIEEIKNNRIYENAFEWRFEFPEVLNEEGDFVGFDVVIGNPPYGVKLSISDQEILNKIYGYGTTETAILFIKFGFDLLNTKGYQSFIIPKSFTYASNYKDIRLLTLPFINSIVDCGMVWADVKLEVCIFQLNKSSQKSEYENYKRDNDNIIFNTVFEKSLVRLYGFYLNDISKEELSIAEKITKSCIWLKDISQNRRGEGLQRKILIEGKQPVIGGIDISRERVKSFRGFINNKESLSPNSLINQDSILVQNIVAHILYPKAHIKITACLPKGNDLIILDTINQITITNSYYSNKLIWCFLNSKLINWFVYLFIYGKAIRTMHFDNYITNRIPIPKIIKADLNELLTDLVDKVIQKEHISQETIISIDDIVYEMYNLTESEIQTINSSFINLN